MKELNCKTLEINTLTEQIFQIRLQPEKGKIFSFKGGQYLYLLMDDGKRIPLSIASPPEEKRFIELHIRLIPGHELAARMLELFKTANKIHIEGPYGQCFLKSNKRDVVIIAGGTGFSPMKSLLESALAQATNKNFYLYLGAQKPDELYQTKLINHWKSTAHFKYIPVVIEAGTDWKGAVGYPHQAALTQLTNDITEYDFYISGSENMVMNVYHELISSGVSENNIYSDILDIKRELGKLT